MKKFRLILGMAVMALILVFGSATAEIAVDLTESCQINLAGKKNPNGIADRKFTSYVESKSMKEPALTVTCDTPMYGLYLCFQKMPAEYEIQVSDGGAWTTLTEGDTRFHHVFYELDGVTGVKVVAKGDKKQVMGFNEIYAFGEGNIPEWVQRWEETPEKADVLFVVTHPGEESLFFGGAIPYYAAEKNSSVAVACFSYANTTRRSEFLNGLWSMGYRQYPVFGDFKTATAKSVASAYKNAGEDKVLSWLTGVIRSVKPEVIVGPDLQGEGGNGQRMMVADACRKCFSEAAEGSEGWQAKKLYLHLFGDEGDRTVFDWTVPMTDMNGLTPRDLAYYAYLYHKTQDDQDRTVLGTGAEYANDSYGLVESAVGADTEKNDFLENITDLTGHTTAKSEPLWSPEEIPGWPELNEKGFLDEGEFIWSDDAHGHYVYVSTTAKVIINRRFDGSLPLTWFESELWCDLESGELPMNLEYTPEKAVGKKKRVDAALNAVANKMVFAVNMDYYTYRVGSKNGKPVGVEVRNGEIYFDDRYTYVEDKFFPNLDTLAIYKDGSVDVHHSVDLSAREYLDQGAYLVYSFGPYLLKEGELSEWVTDPTKSRAKNPRHSFGMIEPGHYIDIMCEGRLGSRSEGVTMPQLALLSRAAGCVESCDMDGGQTAVVVFMGKQLNKIGKYDGKTAARETCEIFGVGLSDQVGQWEIR